MNTCPRVEQRMECMPCGYPLSEAMVPVDHSVPCPNATRGDRIRDSECVAATVMHEERCISGSFLVYSIDSQLDCVWFT